MSTELALLEFRNTPITGMELSPAQLLMSRRLQSALLMTRSLLTPAVSRDASKQLAKRQEQQERYYNRGTRRLPSLSEGDTVRYKCGSVWQPAIVVSKHPTAPRSYLIRNSQQHVLRRNRRHLKQTNELPPKDHIIYDNNDDDDEISSNSPPTNCDENTSPVDSNRHSESSNGQRVSRYGRIIRPPTRYIDSADT